MTATLMNTVSKKFVELLIPAACAFAMMAYMGVTLFSAKGMLTFIILGLACELFQFSSASKFASLQALVIRSYAGASIAAFIGLV